MVAQQSSYIRGLHRIISQLNDYANSGFSRQQQMQLSGCVCDADSHTYCIFRYRVWMRHKELPTNGTTDSSLYDIINLKRWENTCKCTQSSDNSSVSRPTWAVWIRIKDVPVITTEDQGEMSSLTFQIPISNSALHIFWVAHCAIWGHKQIVKGACAGLICHH